MILGWISRVAASFSDVTAKSGGLEPEVMVHVDYVPRSRRSGGMWSEYRFKRKQWDYNISMVKHSLPEWYYYEQELRKVRVPLCVQNKVTPENDKKFQVQILYLSMFFVALNLQNGTSRIVRSKQVRFRKTFWNRPHLQPRGNEVLIPQPDSETDPGPRTCSKLPYLADLYCSLWSLYLSA